MAQPRVVLNVFGGVVQDTFSSDAAIDVIVVDWDAEGADLDASGLVDSPLAAVTSAAVSAGPLSVAQQSNPTANWPAPIPGRPCERRVSTMRKISLQIYDQYRFGPRSVLLPGDRFRVSDGPVYITDAGRTVPMFERGTFVFHRFCVRGAAKWIEANRQDGAMVVLWVGKSCRSPVEANLHRRPYRITGKVSNP